jgi:hypothetical protein
VTDRETKEVRDQRAAEEFARDKAWYEQQRSEAREIAGRAGQLARTMIAELHGETYDSLTKHGLEGRISPFVELPEVGVEDVRMRYARVFVAYAVEQTHGQRRRGWFGRRQPGQQEMTDGAVSRVGIHYYAHPDHSSYRGATIEWDGSLHGSVADATLTLGVLQALVDLRHHESSEDAPEAEAIASL